MTKQLSAAVCRSRSGFIRKRPNNDVKRRTLVWREEMFLRYIPINSIKPWCRVWTDMKPQQTKGTERYWALLSAIEHHWALLSAIERYWALLSAIERYWALLNAIECYWALLSAIERYWTLLNAIECYWALLSAIERYWTLLNTVERASLNMCLAMSDQAKKKICMSLDMDWSVYMNSMYLSFFQKMWTCNYS